MCWVKIDIDPKIQERVFAYQIYGKERKLSDKFLDAAPDYIMRIS
jgi:hypothetical protein